jgi:hypothetical protein
MKENGYADPEIDSLCAGRVVFETLTLSLNWRGRGPALALGVLHSGRIVVRSTDGWHDVLWEPAGFLREAIVYQCRTRSDIRPIHLSTL